MSAANVSVIVRPFLAAVGALERERQKLQASILTALSQSTPGWNNVKSEDVSIDNLGGAMTNLIFKVSKSTGGNSEVLVRIYGEGTETFFARTDETQLFQLLSQHNIGVALLGEFTNGRVEKFIEGVTFTSKDMRKPELSKIVAYKMRQFHGLNLPIEHHPTILYEIHRLLHVAQTKCVGEKFQNVVDFDQFSHDVDELEQIVSRISSPVVMCHNDLQYGNLMKTETGVVLIDFEYSSYNPRGYDIGNHFCEWAYDYHKTINSHLGDFTKYPSVEQQQAFCRAYLAGEDGEEDAVSVQAIETLCEEANTYSLASHLFWALWGWIQASQSEIDFDFMAYGQCRYEAFKKRLTLPPTGSKE